MGEACARVTGLGAVTLVDIPRVVIRSGGEDRAPREWGFKVSRSRFGWRW